MRKAIRIGALLFVAAIAIAILVLILTPGAGPAPIRERLQTVQKLVGDAIAKVTHPGGEADKPSDADKPDATRPPARRPARDRTNAPRVVAGPVPASDLKTPPPAPPPSEPAADVAPPRPDWPAGTTLYLPGQLSSWKNAGVAVASPVVLRAAGEVSTGQELSGPAGLVNSVYAVRLTRQDRPSGSNRRALASAPYLALIGRVCSDVDCSDPFLIGDSKTLCPTDAGITGTLQVWTNNYVRLGGMQTLANYSGVSGGFWVHAEPAPPGACGSAATAKPAPLNATALAPGGVLSQPDFVVSSSQVGWKPFFVPLGAPLLIRASGQMQPRTGAMPTGPEGIPVSHTSTWSYPGTPAVTVDAQHRLFAPSLPYQALIGRLCGAAGCGPIFLVGRQHVLCPAPPYDTRLELWINHIIVPPGMLGSETPLRMQAFDLQLRRGQYQFDVQGAPVGACGGLPSPAGSQRQRRR